MDRYIVGLDLGSKRTSLCVAFEDERCAEIKYFKSIKSEGISNSKIWNITKAEKVVSELILDAEKSLNIKISKVVTNTPRYLIESLRDSNKITINEDNAITEETIQDLKRFAKDNFSTADKTIYSIVPQSFSTTDMIQCNEEDIIGVYADEIEMHYKLYVGSSKDMSKIDKLLQNLGISSVDNYFSPEIVGPCVLENNEMEKGVILLDLGADCSSISIFHDGILRYYHSIPFGGNDISRDIQNEANIDEELAENIKLGFGNCMPERLFDMSNKELIINMDTVEMNRRIRVKYLSEIIAARQKEILEALFVPIVKKDMLKYVRTGVVMIGGAAEMTNLANLINNMTGYNVRIGYEKALIVDGPYTAAEECDGANCVAIVEHAIKETKVDFATQAEQKEVNLSNMFDTESNVAQSANTSTNTSTENESTTKAEERNDKSEHELNGERKQGKTTSRGSRKKKGFLNNIIPNLLQFEGGIDLFPKIDEALDNSENDDE